MARVVAPHGDRKAYFRFTGLQRLDSAMHTLHGLVQGISADCKASDDEVKSLITWTSQHAEFSENHPFNEVIPAINRIVADGVVDEEERADLLWLCSKFDTENVFYDQVTSDIQRLHGYIAGIVADGIINDLEIESLTKWVDEHAHLRCCWPYDELESYLVHFLRDGKIDAQEHEALLQFFAEFAPLGARSAVGVLNRELTVSGVCAMTPEILFRGNLFCITGTSERGPREHLVETVEKLGGKFHCRIIEDTDYLVVGADGNPCWAYACYGRKIEEAVRRRRNGHRLLIVHEFDFWDAVEDAA